MDGPIGGPSNRNKRKKGDKTMKTNNLVLAFTGPYMTDVIIALDLGPYGGTRPDLDVRRLDIKYTGRAASHTATEIAASRAGYGCGWGSTSKLWPISADESVKIIAEIESAAAKADEHPLDWKGICPRCSTYCEGDCCN